MLKEILGDGDAQDFLRYLHEMDEHVFKGRSEWGFSTAGLRYDASVPLPETACAEIVLERLHRILEILEAAAAQIENLNAATPEQLASVPEPAPASEGDGAQTSNAATPDWDLFDTPDGYEKAIDTGKCWHSDDCRTVVWKGKAYHFTGPQARFVQLLWDRCKRGNNAGLKHDDLVRIEVLSPNSDTESLFKSASKNGIAWREVVTCVRQRWKMNT